jgi:hypothetical protein
VSDPGAAGGLGGLGRALVVIGLVVAAVGALLALGGDRLPFGRLPGDFAWKRKGVSIYFPLATCLVLSIVLTLLARLFFRGK